ncbi:MAG: LysR family transcriptional regulator [Oribacterium sp.]|nr:LysR family transcriptional regulator [Oribacterium sp.]
MEYKQFKYVLKIAELGNLTKAAEELYITQPSLSHYIARVEDELGTQLFDRTTNPLSLTLAGERYCETARMILKLDTQLRKDVTDIAENKVGKILLGMSHARAAYFLPYIVPDFIKRYSRIEIRLKEQRSNLLEEYVFQGSCDLAVMPLPLSGKYSLQSESVMREELLLVSGRPLPHEIRGDGRPYVNFTVLNGQQFTLLHQGHGIRMALDAIFMEHELRPGHVFETTSNEVAYRLSTAGIGIAIVPESTVLLSAAVERPYIYSLTEQGLFWHIAAVYRDKNCLTEPQCYLIELMKTRFLNAERHVILDMKSME